MCEANKKNCHPPSFAKDCLFLPQSLGLRAFAMEVLCWIRIVTIHEFPNVLEDFCGDL